MTQALRFRPNHAGGIPPMHEIAGQVHWHEPSGFKRAGFGKFNRPKTPYDLFMESDGHSDLSRHRRQQGAKSAAGRRGRGWADAAATFSFTAPKANGAPMSSKCRAPARSTPKSTSTRRSIWSSKAAARPRSGSTATSKRHVFEWQKGSLFSIPVNAMHRIVNASSAPALLLAGTTAPNLMNLINNVDAIFNCPYQFRDRFLRR